MKRNKIVITGAAGFIGSRLAIEFIKSKQDIVLVDKLSHFETRPQISQIYEGKEQINKIDREDFQIWLQENQSSCKHIFHLGACTNTYEMDKDYLSKRNTEYSKNLWKIASKHEIPFFYASSAAIYGNGEKGYDDRTSLNNFTPLNPYGLSKLLFDSWVLERNRENRPPIWAGFRFFNVYGYGEKHKGKMSSVFGHAFQQINESGKVKLFRSHKNGIEDGLQKRDFILVDDIVTLLFGLTINPLPNGVYNLGTGNAKSFIELAESVFHAMGKNKNIEFIDTPLEIRENYQYFTQANIEKLRSTGFVKEFTSLEKGSEIYWGKIKNEMSLSP
ncbi:MAG: ADP-glyceromanno-heptose 6-epimerase [Nitrospinota bacterium]|nr:ADP-glyceromanno-heptose 6-epimerase [Nitrospinota bacterium]